MAQLLPGMPARALAAKHAAATCQALARHTRETRRPWLVGTRRSRRPRDAVKGARCTLECSDTEVQPRGAGAQVALLLFGENFPPATSPPAEQLFSMATASIGLVSFALILALVEQVLRPPLSDFTLTKG